MTLNKDSHQTILNVKKLKKLHNYKCCFSRNSENFFSYNCTISNQKYILTRAN